MSKFKKGDLVILLRASNHFCKPFVGYIATLGEPAFTRDGYWFMDPPLIASDGKPCAFHEMAMRRIDNPGDDAVDEVIQRIGTPHKEVA